MKFKAGDYFQVQASEDLKLGKILKTQNTEYVIEWEHFRNKCFTYDAKDVDNVWEVSSKSFLSTLDPLKLTEVDIEKTPKARCSHQWKLYHGFRESYEYCELCPAKREVRG